MVNSYPPVYSLLIELPEIPFLAIFQVLFLRFTTMERVMRYVVLFCLMLFSGALAGNGDSLEIYKWQKFNSFGFNASSVSGLGLSYRYHAVGPNLVMLSGGIVSSNDWVAASLGAEYQYEISEREDLRYYLAIGGGLYYTEDEVYDGFSPEPVTSMDTDFHLGVGVGFEYPFLGSSIFRNMTVGLTLYYPAIYFNNSGTDIGMGVGAYFFYNF